MYHRRFDMAPSLPHNFAVVGDALMRLNPIFAQGCAKAGQDVTSLDAELRRCTGSAVPDGFAKRLLKIQTSRDRVFFDSTRMNGELWSDAWGLS
jgi:2-polyprenyl-6-methoxyphenol hydroxylase-like FAD-dependent oxidoreductase